MSFKTKKKKEEEEKKKKTKTKTKTKTKKKQTRGKLILWGCMSSDVEMLIRKKGKQPEFLD
jgi:hypothetical protein